MDKLLTFLGILCGFAGLPILANASIEKVDKEKTTNQRGNVKVEPLPTLTNPLHELYKKYGWFFGVDPCLLKAIASVESSENPKAYNSNSECYGLMQILCQSDVNGKCKNKLYNVQGWPPSTNNRLFDAELNVKIGTQILAWNMSKYGMLRGIACYNSWSARKDPKYGPFRNQNYVDKVMGLYEQFKASRLLS